MRPGYETRSRRRTFIGGMLCGIVLLLSLRLLVNNTSLPDRIVAPLVLADTTGQADAIVVLGAGLVGRCVLNLNGLRRVMLAAQLWHNGRAPVVLFTGGVPDGMSCSVAAMMADFGERLGIPRDRIRLETASHSTHQNAVLSAPVLHKDSVERVLLVTDRLHMRRAIGAFAQFRFAIEHASVPVYEGHTDNVSMLTAAAREAVAIGYYKWRGWL